MKKLILLLCLFLSFGGFAPYSPTRVVETNQIIAQFIQKFAPDRRTTVFQIEAVVRNGQLVLVGKTNMIGAKSFLTNRLHLLKIDFKDEVRYLPEEELGEKIFAIINNSVCNIRSTPKHSGELSTQALLGTVVTILEKEGAWYSVQTPDRYIGWVDGGAIKRVTKEEIEDYKQWYKLIITVPFAYSFSEEDTDSQTVSDLVFGDLLELKSESAEFYHVAYPDGRMAYIRKSEAQMYNKWHEATKATESSLVKAGKKMMGVPYLWGGTSTKGVDCSGFTKTSYLMNGIVLPRDASQQAQVGENIDTSKGFEDLKPGDLLFFGGEKVVHVAMWIGHGQFIHSGGKVEIKSFDPKSPLFDEYNLNRFLFAKRVLGTSAEKWIE